MSGHDFRALVLSLHLKAWRWLHPARRRWVPRSLWWKLAPSIPLVVHTAASLDQSGFQFYNDDGTESTATSVAAEDTDATLEVDTVYHLRIQVDDTASGVENNLNMQLQRNLNSGGWVNVDGSSSVVQSAASQLTDGSSTTARLTAPAGGSFISPNSGQDEANGIAGESNDMDFADGTHDYVEAVFAFQIPSGDVANDDVIQFRVVRSGGTVLESYGITPQATVSKAPEGTATQEAFRVRLDDTALNTDGGWSAAQDTDASLEAEQTIRIRFRVKASGGSVASGYQLRYSRNGGAYTALPVQAAPVGDGIIPEAIESTPSDQYADDDATTEILTGATGTFVGGRADEASNVTSSISLADTEYTELEFAVRIRKFYWTGAAVAENADGTTFDFRVYKSDGTALDTYSATPRVTVDSAGLVGGCWPECPHFLGPIVDSNDNMYFFMEAWEDKTNGGDIVALKSTDGGVTWTAQDLGNGPAGGDSDFEGCSIVQDNQTTGVIHIFSHHSTTVDRHEFHTSDHATTPDTWGTIDSLVQTFTEPLNSQQFVSACQRSDGDLIVFYNTSDGTTDQQVEFVISTDGGANWGTPVNLDGTAGRSIYQAWPVVAESDLTYIFYIDNSGPTDDLGHVYYKTLTSADVLTADGSRVQVSSNTLAGGVGERGAILGATYYDDDGVETVHVAWADSNQGTTSGLTRALFDGTLQAIKTATDNGVSEGGSGGSNQFVGDLSVNASAKSLHLVYADTATRDVFYTTETDDGGWNTDTEEQDAADADWVRAHVVTRSGTTYVAYVFDDGTGTGGGGQGPVYYDEIELATSGVSQAIGQASEADTAQPVGQAKAATIGQALETDTAQSVTAETATVVEVGQAIETDTAQPVSAAKTQTIGQAVESDTAQSVAAAKTAAVGQAIETDTAQGVSGSQAQVVGQATETDTAQQVTAAKTQTIGQATEADTAQAVTAIQAIQVGQAVEADTAQVLTWAKQLTIGLASETDTAQTVSAGGALAVGQAAETDTAFAVAVVKAQTVGQALETDTAFALAAIKVQAIGRALETDTAASVGSLKLVVIGQASETDTAFAVASIQLVAIGQATESDTAQPVSVVKVDIIGQATETDMAFALTVFGVVLAIKALAYYRFYRINGHLVAGAVGRGGHRGYRTSEGYERVSDVVRIDESPENGADIESAMAALSSAWATHSGSSTATLKAAIHSALQDAGWRGQGGVDLA